MSQNRVSVSAAGKNALPGKALFLSVVALIANWNCWPCVAHAQLAPWQQPPTSGGYRDAVRAQGRSDRLVYSEPDLKPPRQTGETVVPSARRAAGGDVRKLAIEEESAEGVPEPAELDTGSPEPEAPQPRPPSPRHVPARSIDDRDGDGCDAGPCKQDRETAYSCRCPGLGDRLHNRLWFRTEYLMWWSEGAGAPPLLTQGDAADDRPGALGQPGTVILYPNHGLNRELRSGGRLSTGLWLNSCRNAGVELTYLGLGKDVDRFEAGSTGTPVLARPFVNVEGDPTTDPPTPGGFQDAQFVAIDRPDRLIRGIFTSFASSEFHAAEAMWRRALSCGCQHRVDVLVGYRFQRLDDNLRMAEALQDRTFDIDVYEVDEFDTRNDFHGGELGVLAEWHGRRWSLEGCMKLAVGNTHSRTRINGTTSFNGGPALPGALYGQPSNIGDHFTDQLSVAPELGLTMGYSLTPRLRATLGYTFIFWSNVLRPGDQIDPNLIPSHFVSQAVPAPSDPPPSFQRHTGDYWAQGINFGLDLQF